MTPSQKNPEKAETQGVKKVTGYEQHILNTSSIGVLITRINDGAILYVNKATTSLLGIADADSMIGSPVPNFYWDAEDRKAILTRFRAEGFITSNEVRARKADGSMIWVSLSIQPFNFEGEQVLLSEIVDITDRKQVEEALHASEEQFRSLYDNATIGLYRTTPDGKILMINPTGLKLLGFDSYEELAKRNLEEAGFEEVDARKNFREKLEREGVIEQESVWTRKDGTPIFVRESSTVSRGENGNVLYYDGSFEDITARKQAEEALRTSEQRYQTIFNSSPVMFWLKDAKNNMIQINQAAASFENVNPKDIQGRSSYDIYPHEQAEAFYQDDLVVIRSGTPKLGIVEKHTSPGTGKTTWVETGKVPIWDDKGEVTGILAFGVDITDRQRAEEAIHASEERFKRFTEATVEGLVFHEQGKIIDANPAGLAMFGLTDNADFFGRNLMEFVVPEFHKTVLQQMQLETVLPYEIQCVRKDGTIFPVETSTRVYHDGERIIRATSIRDITKRKQAEEAIRQSQTRFQNLVETLGEWVWEVDSKGTYTYISPNIKTLLGYEPEEVVGKTPFDLMPSEEAQRVAGVFGPLLSTQQPLVGLENTNRRKDGSLVVLETNGVPFFDANGQLLGYRGTDRDVTERKKAEEELKRNVNFTNALLDAIPTPVFYKDQEGRYQGCNRAFTDIMGKTAEEIRGKTVHQLWPSENAEVYHQKDLELMRTPEHQVYEATTKDKNGNVRPVIFAKDVFFDEGGNVAGLVGAFIDISERKQIEQALKESQQLLQLVMDNIPQAVFWKDKELTYLGANQSFAEDAGLASPQELVGKKDFDMPWKEQAELYRADDQKILDSGEAKIGYEEQQTGPTGGITWVRTSKVPMRDADGNVFAVLGMYEDITEQRVLRQQVQESFERRGYQVQISTEISQEIASASELSDLFSRVVTLTKERLGYYHTQLLRYDTTQDAVVLINGYGEIGQKMLAGGHQMPMGSGLIGAAAESGQTVLRSTLADDPDWHPNPLLPETKGEIAVPIKWQDNILGVLDVQSNQAGALTDDDRLLLEGLCGQIAIAMQSAELVETIRQNEARLEEAASIAQLGYWEFDALTDTYTFTDQFYALLRTTAEREGGYQMSSREYTRKFMHPDDDYMVGSEIQKSIETVDPDRIEQFGHRFIRADGSEGYVTGRSRVVKDAQGRTVKTVGFNQDITERKLAEEALRRSEQLTRSVIDSTPDWIFIKDQEHRYQLANKGYADALHIAPEDFIGKNDLELGFPEELVKGNPEKGIRGFWTDDRLVMDSNETLVYPDDPATIDGMVHNFHTIKVPLRDADGKAWGVLAFARDITDRKQAEEALRRSEQEMAERLEEISHLYSNMSREGWKTYRETAELPKGFMFDQTGVRPVEDMALASESFSQVPMKVLGGEVVGTLSVANDPRNPTSLEDLVFLQQVSDQVALALEGARLSVQTQSALAQTEKLSEAGLLFTRASDLQEVVRIAVETLGISKINRAAMETFNYNSANEVESMDVLANWWNGTGHATTTVGTRYTPEVLPLIQLFLTPIPVFIKDAFEDERVDGVSLQIIKYLNIHAVAVLPLFLADQQIGVLLLESEETHEFNQDEIRLFSAMGPQISTVLENRRQYERAQKQAEREGMLNIISQKIQSATSVEAVLQIAARELGHALGAPMTIAQLSMKDKK